MVFIFTFSAIAGLFDKYVAAKKFWILRSMQQRYQLTLRGIGPILKEWDIVFEIYENQLFVSDFFLDR